jgi:hypothetical protein
MAGNENVQSIFVPENQVDLTGDSDDEKDESATADLSTKQEQLSVLQVASTTHLTTAIICIMYTDAIDKTLAPHTSTLNIAGGSVQFIITTS